MSPNFRNIGRPWVSPDQPFDDAMEDPGLRQYLLTVYNFMAAALALSFGAAYLAVASGFYQKVAGTPLIWVIMLAPLVAVIFLSVRLEKIDYALAQIVFWLFAILMGLSLGGIFLIFTGTSIAATFLVSAATFAAMSLYGYTTGQDLSRLGGLLLMVLVGLILAAFINFFIGSSLFQLAISAVGVLTFVGLTAYDTQRIKTIYFSGDSVESTGRKALLGALALYLDFINLFVMLLNFTGRRRR